MAGHVRKVVLVHERFADDARPDEVDALAQAQQVGEALTARGWQVDTFPVGLDLGALKSYLEAEKPALVFNLVEQLAGDGRLIVLVPALLDTLGMPYSGCRADAMYLTSQKLLGKAWLRGDGIAVPDDLSTDTGTDDARRWMVKSVWEHASLGIDDGSVVNGTAQACARLDYCHERYGGEWFAEAFVDGREFNISLIEHDGQPYVLPLAEMTFVDFPENKPRIVGYAAKWDPDAPEYRNTVRCFPDLDDALHAELTAVAQRCWRRFGLSGYARVDLRLDAAGCPQVLEVNANPCLSRDAGFAAAAEAANIDYPVLVERIAEAAIRPALRRFRRSA